MTREPNEEEMDEFVADIYRELAAPKAPDHLNQSILRMAASRSPGNGKFLFAAWIKPAAWAATIALSLAIVLELSELPTTSLPMDVVPAAPAKGLLEELVIKDKGRTDSFAASPAAIARPVARKRAADQPKAGRQVAAEAVASALFLEKKELDTATTCDPEVRKSSIDWLTCIESLRESGAAELADREYAAFILEYPNESADSESNK